MQGISEALWNWNELPPARDDEFVQAATVPTSDPVSLHFGAIKAGFDSVVHFHPYDQWQMVFSGAAIMWCRDTEHRLSPGSVLRIPAGMPHRLVVVEDLRAIEFGLGVEPGARPG